MIIGIIIGIFLWIIGILVFVSDFSKAKRCTGETTAVIVDVTKETHLRHGKHAPRGPVTYYYPIIEFSTPEKSYRVKANIKTTNSDTCKKGNQLKIQYNPQNPYDLKLQGNSKWDGAIGMGIFFLLGAVLMFISMRSAG